MFYSHDVLTIVGPIILKCLFSHLEGIRRERAKRHFPRELNSSVHVFSFQLYAEITKQSIFEAGGHLVE